MANQTEEKNHEIIVEMKNIDMRFQGVHALDDVSITLRRGEVHALMGENGAGKSTLMKILVGLYVPTKGEIYYKGKQVHFKSVMDTKKAGISMIFQEFNQVKYMMVMENIYLGREPMTRTGCVDYQKMYEDSKRLLEGLGVDLDPKARMADLTVAKFQLVEIVKASSFNVKILVMDEPTSSLSDEEVEKLFETMTRLKEQKVSKYSGGIYHKTQIDLTYNSNHIEGSSLTHDQTRYIFETNTIGVEKEVLNVDDVIETANHFRCIDMIIDNAKGALTEKFIKELHNTLKTGTSDSRKDWFAVGDYKKMPNEVGGMETALPEEVADKMKALLTEYNGKEEKTFEDILDFHVKFERIHPFQDGNGRVGRLIMFKECLKYNIVPFIIEDHLKLIYYRGLKEWDNEKGYLTDTCLTAQDKYKVYLDYFRIEY